MSEEVVFFGIMRLIYIAVLCFARAATGGWLKDLISPTGWDVGDGVVLHLVDSKLPNSTFLERHKLLMDYGEFGVSVTHAAEKRAIEVGLHPDARGSKDSESAAVSMIIGYKLATMATLAFSAVGALVMKALSVAKIAAVLSMILLVSKLFHQHKEHQTPSAIIEVEQPEFIEVPPEYLSSATADYYSYANFPPGIDYSVPESSGVNSTAPENQQVGVSRRRDVSKRRKVPLLTIHQYSIKS